MKEELELECCIGDAGDALRVCVGEEVTWFYEREEYATTCIGLSDLDVARLVEYLTKGPEDERVSFQVSGYPDSHVAGAVVRVVARYVELSLDHGDTDWFAPAEARELGYRLILAAEQAEGK